MICLDSKETCHIFLNIFKRKIDFSFRYEKSGGREQDIKKQDILPINNIRKETVDGDWKGEKR